MNNNNIKELENSVKLKKRIFSKNIWKNYAIIPPAIVLFTGILGVVYLLNIDKLLTWYAIPFLVIFALGTIWLKSTRRYLINKKISDSNEFLICLSIPLIKKENKTIMLFSTGKNRNNKHYLEKEKKDILGYDLDGINLSHINNKPKQVNDSDIFIVQLPLSKKFSGKSQNEYWVIFSGADSIDFLTSSEINKHS
ncbi:hypothetical protein LJC00_00700 [Dysgonomonas sp. OttesenSCG-928-M03]|nr:hypothetical protein [Dysgonomonas sp. OttesenSCG-928-M03]